MTRVAIHLIRGGGMHNYRTWGSGHNKCTQWGPTLCRGRGTVCKIPPVWLAKWTTFIGLKIWVETFEGCMKLALLEKWHREVWIFFLVSTPDRVGAIQTRHHLLRWGKGVYEETTFFGGDWWVLSEYNSFDHFPYKNFPCLSSYN